MELKTSSEQRDLVNQCISEWQKGGFSPTAESIERINVYLTAYDRVMRIHNEALFLYRGEGQGSAEKEVQWCVWDAMIDSVMRLHNYIDSWIEDQRFMSSEGSIRSTFYIATRHVVSGTNE